MNVDYNALFLTSGPEILQQSDDLNQIITNHINHALLGYFYENVGQTGSSDILFQGRTGGTLVGFGANRIVLVGELDNSLVSFVLDTEFEVTPIGENESKHTTNYFGNNGMQFTNIRGFSCLTYPEVWPGISVSCIASQNGILLRFDMALNSNSENIKIRTICKGIQTVNDVSVVFNDHETHIVIDNLKAHQGTKDVNANYLEVSLDTFGIQVEKNDSSSSISIESVLHTTTFGGSNFDIPFALILDKYGNAYVTGYTTSSDFPLQNPLDETLSGKSDCFVFKIDMFHNSIIYSTYIGGSNNDVGTTIGTDEDGNVYVSGRTQSMDFPTVSGYCTSFKGGTFDCFLFKLNSEGNQLIYSTYFGGSGNDYAESIAVDSEGFVYVTGYTGSLDFPTYNGYCLVYCGGFSDTFTLKFDQYGQSIIYSTYIGGSKTDCAVSIALDNVGCVYIAGYTYSDDFPIIKATDYTYNGYRDSIIYKLTQDGNHLVYSTYLGGGWIDQAESISVNINGTAIIVGTTYSSDFPTINSYDDSLNGGSDCFIAAIDTNGSSLLFSTFLGGSADDFGFCLSIDSEGYIYISGSTESLDFPTASVDITIINGTSSSFITKFNPFCDTLLYSTFLGGFLEKSIRALDIYSTGAAFIGGFRSFNVTIQYLHSSFLTFSTDVFILQLDDFGDSDFDGIADYVENELGLNRFNKDTDGDSLDDARELFSLGTNPKNNDTDSDGVNDALEVDTYHTNPLLEDSDGDNLDDFAELFQFGTNPNAIDSDSDTLDDYEEINIYGTNPLSTDSDSDMLSDANEIQLYGTNPLSNDTDVDTLPDYWEISSGLNPLFDDSMLDLDFDNLTNIEEYLYGTLPYLNDTDSDLLYDFLEVKVYETNPNCKDSDNDHLSDYDEIMVYGTNATNSDTDSDLMLDFWEIQYGLNAHVNDSANDSDLDGLSNLLEYQHNSNPNLNDTDGDNLDDYLEVFIYGTLPNKDDTDKDTLSDYDEIFIFSTNPNSSDTDSDELRDDYEIWVSLTNPLSNDTDLDLMDDEWEIMFLLDPFVNDSSDDADFDGLSNLVEYIQGTNPQENDTDYDNLSDIDELYIFSTNPSSNDTDSDLVRDDLELFLYFTNPNDNDTENDSMPDGWEIQFGLDPTYDDSLVDLDLDGLSNLQEYVFGSNPLENDSDYDSLDDFSEAIILGTSPSSEDTDSDIMSDSWELFLGLNPLVNDSNGDLDADNLINVLEFLNNANPLIGDTDSDALTDFEEVVLYHTKPDFADSDNDSLSDWYEVKQYGTNPIERDTDFDFIPDSWEVLFGLNPLLNDSNTDFDNDQLTNLEEYNSNTNPALSDSDFDLLSDYDELSVYCTNPIEPDSDFDQLDDYSEIQLLSTNPLSNDSDSDTLPDFWEVTMGINPLIDDSNDDSDNDGLINLLEYQYGSDPKKADSDFDEISDYNEIYTYGTNPANDDSDNDLLSDNDEIIRYGTDPLNYDSDSDGIRDGFEILFYSTNPLSSDSDHDVMPDNWEIKNGLNPLLNDAGLDSDKDRLVNLVEFQLGTNPHKADSDSDGLSDYSEYYFYGTSPKLADTDRDLVPDGWEIRYGLNALSNDSFIDSDSDGLTNLQEYQNNASPLKSDSDGDELSDFEEVFVYSTNPMLNDSDYDTLTDYEEIILFGTNPSRRDSDDDGIPDPWELEYNLDPLAADADLDLDSDNLTNLIEYYKMTNPLKYDSDEDGLNDFVEVNILNTNPNSADTDSDELSDFYEVYTSNTNPSMSDTDLDGLTDSLEVELGTNPNFEDSDNDGLSDLWEVTNGYDPINPSISLVEFLHYHVMWIVIGVSSAAIILLIFFNRRTNIRPFFTLFNINI